MPCSFVSPRFPLDAPQAGRTPIQLTDPYPRQSMQSQRTLVPGAAISHEFSRIGDDQWYYLRVHYIVLCY